MGLTATINEGNVIIRDGQTIVQEYFLQSWKKMMESALHGGDYLEISAHRSPHSDDLWAEENDLQDEKDNRADYLMNKRAQCPEQAHQRLPLELGSEDKAKRRGETLVSISMHGFFNTTLEDLSEEFRSVQMRWDQSKECKVLVVQLGALKENLSRHPVTNIIALGVGTLHGSPRKDMEGRSGLQLAAVQTMRNALGEVGSPLPCTIQDPSYSKIESEFLTSLGFDVVNDPDGFHRINAHSLVFNIGTYLTMAWSISDGTWPAAMVTSDWGNASPLLCKNTPWYCARDVRAMFKHYDHEPLIDIEHGNSIWARQDLYWQKQSQPSTT